MNSCSNKVGIARFVRRFADFRLNDKIRIARQICLLYRKIMSPFDFGNSERRHLTACLTRRLCSPEKGLNTQKLAEGSYLDLIAEQGLVSFQTDLMSFTKTATNKRKKVKVKINDKARNTFPDFSIYIYSLFLLQAFCGLAG
jgi:hypothetical protein